MNGLHLGLIVFAFGVLYIFAMVAFLINEDFAESTKDFSKQDKSKKKGGKHESRRME